YLPSCPPGSTHEVRQQHGMLLDPASLPEVPVYTPPASSAPADRKRSALLGRPLADWAARFCTTRIAELASMPPESGRNNACNRLAHLLGGLVANPQHGLSADYVADQLFEACTQNGLL